MSEFLVRIRGDVLVAVPPSPRFMTTYVLMEQEDWFEKEIRFVRKFLQPGMHAIDIGANFGVYALTMAKAVQPGGSVTAFEPARATAAMLHRSIARNQFNNLRLIAMALSAAEGTTTLHTYENSELNSLSAPRSPSGGQTEQVAVSTLDCQQRELDWPAIDFVKIDAEGEESNIIAGGEKFFAAQSPLVMFEIVDASQDRNLDLTLPAFRRLGYDIYRLIGPDCMLVPLVSRDVAAFEYNLFACKPDRAARLAAAGLLALPAEAAPEFSHGAGRALFDRQTYAAAFGALAFRDGGYEAALDAYAMWCRPDAPPGLRYAGLSHALTAMRAAARGTQSLARLSSLARCAIDAGERAIAIETLNALLAILTGKSGPPEEPFFPAAKRYDAIDPQSATRSWLLAATFEAAELMAAPTGYFRPANARMAELYDWFAMTPFLSAEMERRRQLLRMQSGAQSGIVPTPILARAAPDHLNVALWSGR